LSSTSFAKGSNFSGRRVGSVESKSVGFTWKKTVNGEVLTEKPGTLKF
jgi:hypothetical protein